jgi:predicted GNAT family N-acyltransferase
VAIETTTGRVAAYYTLAAASVPVTDLPAELTKKLPRYPSIASVLIGRLAVDVKSQGRGLGAALLADAVQRSLTSAPAAHLLLVDAKDDSAANFYRRYGFVAILGRSLTLFLPVATAVKALR